MKMFIPAMLFMLAASAPAVHAQSANSELTATQVVGRQVFAQSCGVCHLWH